ncbi:MAG: VPLPA-CTERM sorting domain-containing protein [Alphaproteobacteria bacterium]|nr:VPLPA-CTERM sorting domain-containing protein [Alphaproteobacteria bacterium]
MNHGISRWLMTTALSLAAVPALAAPVDLTTWAEKGNSGNGTWTVEGGGTSVLQTINGDPTFFVSPTSLINKKFTGKITVTAAGAGDDDYIGFVFGFNNPTGNTASGNDNYDFVLFDWKQGDQSSGGFLAREGFNLSRVNGTITDLIPGFWGHTDSTGFDVLETSYSATSGWVESTEYTFEITYQETNFKLVLSGGAFGAGTTIFDVAGSFPNGAFGFYNYSQAQVRYSGLTEDEAPPPPPPPPPPPVSEVPVPATALLFGAGLAGLGMVRRRRAS